MVASIIKTKSQKQPNEGKHIGMVEPSLVIKKVSLKSYLRNWKSAQNIPSQNSAL